MNYDGKYDLYSLPITMLYSKFGGTMDSFLSVIKKNSRLFSTD